MLLALHSSVLWSQEDPLERFSTDSLEVDAVVSYVNTLFDQYNRFDSKIAFIKSNSTLVFTDRFSRLSAAVSELEFRRVGENMGMYCSEGTNCLTQTDVPTGEEEPPRNAYTFGIKQQGEARPETDTVISLLNRLLTQLHTTNMRNATNALQPELYQLIAINNILEAYIPEEARFSIHDENLAWKVGDRSGQANLAFITFYVDYQNKALVFQCIQTDCMEGQPEDQFRLELVTSEGDIAPEMDALLARFNALRKEVLSR